MLECDNGCARTAPYDEIEPLDEGGMEEVVASLKQPEVEATVACLFFDFLSSVN